ncbi:MAG TPA: hypothetical protein VIM55_10245 [Mucilaginibacter sp.]
MKIQHYAAALLLTGTLLSVKITRAQETGLAGSWVLQQKTNLSGVDYRNTVDDSLTVLKTGNRWVLTRSNMGTTNRDTLPEGPGPAASTTKDNRRRIAKVTWQGDQAFTEERSYSAPGDSGKNAHTIRDEYSLSADGRTLTVTRYFENAQDANDKWSAKGEYTRK